MKDLSIIGDDGKQLADALVSAGARLEQAGLSIVAQSVAFDDLSKLFSVCKNQYHRAAQYRSWVLWAIGDILNYGESHYHDQIFQLVGDEDFSTSTLADAKWVAKAIPIEERKPPEQLSWSKHREVASMKDAEKRSALLDEIVKNRMTDSEIRERRKEMNDLGAIHSSKSNEWYTPPRYLELVRAVLGEIDLDPASCEVANQNVQAAKYYTMEDDGLSQPWYGRVFLNPPYGKTGNRSNQGVWTEFLLEVWKANKVGAAISLVNDSTSEAWFQPLWGKDLGRFPICFTDHRPRFLLPDNSYSEAPNHGAALVYLPPPAETLDEWEASIAHFAKVFSEAGNVVRLMEG